MHSRAAFGMGGRGGGSVSTPVAISEGGSNGTSFTSRAMLYYDGTRFTSAPWQVEATTLHLIAVTDDTYDIGKTSGNRPRNVIASQVIVAGTHIKPTGNARARISSPADGRILLEDATGSGTFSRLQLGGTTSSYPALVRSSTTVQARLADDSDFTKIQGDLQTADNAVLESIVPTHTLTLYDGAGTAYKVAVQAA